MDDAAYSLRMDRPWIPLPRSTRVGELLRGTLKLALEK
jgi:hypothetical protein